MPISTTIRFLKQLSLEFRRDRYKTFGKCWDWFDGMMIPVPEGGLNFFPQSSDFSHNWYLKKQRKKYRRWKRTPAALSAFKQSKKNYLNKMKPFSILIRVLRRTVGIG